MTFDKQELAILQCPRCADSLQIHDDRGLRCSSGHIFAVQDDVLVLHPEFTEHDHRAEEEAEFADGSPEAERTKRSPWLWLTRFPQVRRFELEVLPHLGPGRFLEIGGGSCYASAMFKSTFPESVVYASDVAVNTLRNKARPVCSLFPRQPDYLAAIAAECLPFRAGTVDWIFGELFLHHSPNPAEVLREAARVLKPGGRLIIHEPSVPPAFAWLFRHGARSREADLHIHEDLISLDRWRHIVKASGMPLHAIKINTDGQYQTNPAAALAGRLLSALPRRMVEGTFPVGLVLDYQKPDGPMDSAPSDGTLGGS